jgi:hypothetical protein
MEQSALAAGCSTAKIGLSAGKGYLLDRTELLLGDGRALTKQKFTAKEPKRRGRTLCRPGR